MVLVLTVASIASTASAQAPYAFKKDPGSNQQIEYTSNIFYPSWSLVPGGMTTNLAPAAITFNGSTFLFAVKPDNSIWLNKLAGGCSGNWSGWAPFPPGGATDVAVAPVLFAGSLFVIGKGIDDKQLYITWSSDGTSWANWQLMNPQWPKAFASAPAAIALTNSNSSPVLVVAARDATSAPAGKNVYLATYNYSTNAWSNWEYLSYADLGPSLTKYASFSYTPGNCPPTDFCPVVTESDTLYIAVAAQIPNEPGKTIWMGQSTDGGIWSGTGQVQPAGNELLPTTPADPAIFGYPSASGGPGVLVFANAYGSFEGFKNSADPSLKSWGPWNTLPGAPSDVALAVTGAPFPCLM